MLKTRTTSILHIAQDWHQHPINVLELGSFLLHFRTAYLVAYDYTASEWVEATSLHRHGERIRALFSHSALDVSKLSRVMMPEDLDLEFAHLKERADGLELLAITNAAPPMTLPLATILAGGRVDASASVLRIPSLNESIRMLCAAFGLEQPSPLPSELRHRQSLYSGPTPNGG